MAQKPAPAPSAPIYVATGLLAGGTALFSYLVIWPLVRAGTLRKGHIDVPDKQTVPEALVEFSIATLAVMGVIHYTAEVAKTVLETGELPEGILE